MFGSDIETPETNVCCVKTKTADRLTNGPRDRTIFTSVSLKTRNLSDDYEHSTVSQVT